MIRKGAPRSRGPNSSSGGCNCVRLLTVGLFIVCAAWLAMGISMFRSAAAANQQATLTEKLKIAEKEMSKRLRSAELSLENAVKKPVHGIVWHGPNEHAGDDGTLVDHAAMGHDFGAAAAAAGAATPPPEKENTNNIITTTDKKVSSSLNVGSKGMASRVADEAGGIGWDQSEWDETWVKDQSLLPPFWKAPEGTDLDNVGTYVDGEPTIYLMVASYRGSYIFMYIYLL